MWLDTMSSDPSGGTFSRPAIFQLLNKRRAPRIAELQMLYVISDMLAPRRYKLEDFRDHLFNGKAVSLDDVGVVGRP